MSDASSSISIESASYFENNDIEENGIKNEVIENSNEEENIPKLFSEEQDHDTDELRGTEEPIDNKSDQLFEHEINNEDDDFEIPAFLRKQKF